MRYCGIYTFFGAVLRFSDTPYSPVLKPPNLVTLSNIYLGTIWLSKCLSLKFDFNMATTFWQAPFIECKFSPIHWNAITLLKSVLQFILLLCYFIDFTYFLLNLSDFQRFWKSKMAAVWEPDVICTSYDVTSLCCGPRRKPFWTYYKLSKFRFHSLNVLGVKEGAESTPLNDPRRLWTTRIGLIWVLCCEVQLHSPAMDPDLISFVDYILVLVA